MANEQSVLDTHTRPLPDKTVDDLWFDARVYAAYGSMWERTEDSIALAMDRQINSPQPANDDIRTALINVRQSVTLKPRIDEFEPARGFARHHLGTGSGESYWDTQDRFVGDNMTRALKYNKNIKSLENARKVLKRDYRV